jgi:hypothetical protein
MTEKRMKGPEVVEEVLWLLDAGVHPLMVAQVLGRSMTSIQKLGRRYDVPVLRTRFAVLYKVAA